jgi:hypothetical protein
MVKVTYENFREVDIDLVKYVSIKGGRFHLHIINFQKFRDLLLKKFTDEEIEYFFVLFPYSLDSEITQEDKMISIKLEIDFYEEFHLVEINGKEYVLFDGYSERFDDWEFPGEITTLPILLEDFIEIAFWEFVTEFTCSLFDGVIFNLKEKNNEKVGKKYVESVYI